MSAQLLERAMDALCDALPFVEAAPDTAYKPGFVNARRAEIRRLIGDLEVYMRQATDAEKREELRNEIANTGDC